MHPVLFQIGNFPVRSFGVLIVLAFVVALVMAGKRAPRFGLTSTQVQDAAFWMILAGVFGARLMYIALHWSHFSQHPEELYSLRFEGLTSFGGLLGGFAALLIYCKIKKTRLLSILETISVPVLLAHAVGRIGCLLNGCCYGYACATSPPGVHIEGLPGLYQPAQFYDSVMVFFGATVLLWFEKRDWSKGKSFALMLIIYGASRFIYEFWRIGASSELIKGLPVSLAQVTSLVMVLIGVAWVLARPKSGLTLPEGDSSGVS